VKLDIHKRNTDPDPRWGLAVMKRPPSKNITLLNSQDGIVRYTSKESSDLRSMTDPNLMRNIL